MDKKLTLCWSRVALMSLFFEMACFQNELAGLQESYFQFKFLKGIQRPVKSFQNGISSGVTPYNELTPAEKELLYIPPTGEK